MKTMRGMVISPILMFIIIVIVVSLKCTLNGINEIYVPVFYIFGDEQKLSIKISLKRFYN